MGRIVATLGRPIIGGKFAKALRISANDRAAHLRQRISAGKPVPVEQIIRLHQDFLSEGNKIPPDLEEYGLRAALAGRPDDAAMLGRLCAVIQEQGQEVPLELEERALRAALAERPDDAAMLGRLCAVIQEQGQEVPLELEERALRGALAGKSDDAPMLQSLCAVLAKQGRPIPPDLEERALRAALVEHPDQVPLFQRLTELLQQSAETRLTEAVSLARRAHESKPSDFWTNFNLAKAYLYNWRPIDAWSYALKAIDIDPASPYGYELLFNIASRIRDIPRTNRRMRNFVRIINLAQSRYPNINFHREKDFLERQDQAIKRGIPSILLLTQPKSGTLYIRGRLSQGLNIPYCHLTIAPHYNDPIPSWLEDFARGGAVAAEHLDANAVTRRYLKDAGVRKIVVHVRDPRAAALSMVHFTAKQSKYSGPVGTVAGNPFASLGSIENQLEVACSQYIPRWSRRLLGWVDERDKTDSPFEIIFTRYDDFVIEQDKFFNTVLDFYEIDHSLFDSNSDIADYHKLHFRKGDPNEWRKVAGPRVREKMWSVMDHGLCERFGWEP